MEVKKKWILIGLFIIGLILFFKITKNYKKNHVMSQLPTYYKPVHNHPIYDQPNNNKMPLPLNMPPNFVHNNMNSHFMSYPNIHWIRHNR